MRIVAIVVGLILAVMAAIQFNDPDPIYWVVTYSASAIVVIGRSFGWPINQFRILTTGLLLAGLLVSVPGFLGYLGSGDWSSITGSMAGGMPYVEPAREFLGLMIAVIAVLLLGERRERDSRMILR